MMSTEQNNCPIRPLQRKVYIPSKKKKINISDTKIKSEHEEASTSIEVANKYSEDKHTLYTDYDIKLEEEQTEVVQNTPNKDVIKNTIICKQVFNSWESMQKHKHQNKTLSKNSLCLNTLNQLANKNIIKCTKCQMRFFEESTLRVHMLQKHQKDSVIIEQKSNTISEQNCAVNSVPINRKIVISKQNNSIVNKFFTTSDQDEHSLHTEYEVKLEEQHFEDEEKTEAVHNTPIVDDKMNKDVIKNTIICKQVFNTWGSMQKHKQQNETLLKKPLCLDTLNQLANKKIIECTKCQMRFFEESTLRVHMLQRHQKDSVTIKQKSNTISEQNGSVNSVPINRKIIICKQNNSMENTHILSRKKTKSEHEIKSSTLIDVANKYSNQDEHTLHTEYDIKLEEEEKTEAVQNTPIENDKTNKDVIKNTIKRKTNKINYIVCKQVFNSWESMQKHKQQNKTHLKKLGTQNQLTNKKIIECTKCHIRFFKESTYRIHMLQRHQKNSLTIKQKTNTISEQNVTVNSIPIKQNINSSKEYKTKEKSLNCIYCDYLGLNRIHLSQHMESDHSDKKTLECSVCHKRFFKRANLRVHMENIHSGLKRFACEYCGIRFPHRSGLLTHRRLHTGEKPFVCKNCGKGFAQLSSLRSHEKNYSNKMEHICYVCGMTFKRSGTFRVHLRRHTQVKPYKCQVCDNAFGTAETRKRHMRTHTGAKEIECDVCKKMFVTRSVLKLHMMQHTGEKPYSCMICGKGFIKDLYLRTHLASHEAKEI